MQHAGDELSSVEWSDIKIVQNLIERYAKTKNCSVVLLVACTKLTHVMRCIFIAVAGVCSSL